jgi:hypothetical protein
MDIYMVSGRVVDKLLQPSVNAIHFFLHSKDVDVAQALGQRGFFDENAAIAFVVS